VSGALDEHFDEAYWDAVDAAALAANWRAPMAWGRPQGEPQ
jgi:hypothetical protein